MGEIKLNHRAIVHLIISLIMPDGAAQLLAVPACLQSRSAKVQLHLVQKVGLALHECPIVEGSNPIIRPKTPTTHTTAALSLLPALGSVSLSADHCIVICCCWIGDSNGATIDFASRSRPNQFGGQINKARTKDACDVRASTPTVDLDTNCTANSL